VLDFVAGEPEFAASSVYSIAVDSATHHCERPGAFGVHIFDFTQQKYKFLCAWIKERPMLTRSASLWMRRTISTDRYGVRQGVRLQLEGKFSTPWAA